LAPAYRSIAELIAALQKRLPGITWSAPRHRSMEEALATLRFPPQDLTLAAEDTGGTVATARRIGLVDGQVREVAPLRWELESDGSIGSERVIAGRLLDPPAALDRAALLGFLVFPDQAPIAPLAMDWDRGSGVFFMKFEAPSRSGGSLELALLHELQED
jgi:hypothetical protein